MRKLDLAGVSVYAVDESADHGAQVLRVLVALVRERDRLRLLLAPRLVVHAQLVVQLLQPLLPLSKLLLVRLLHLHKLRLQEVLPTWKLLLEVRVVCHPLEKLTMHVDHRKSLLTSFLNSL